MRYGFILNIKNNYTNEWRKSNFIQRIWIILYTSWGLFILVYFLGLPIFGDWLNVFRKNEQLIECRALNSIFYDTARKSWDDTKYNEEYLKKLYLIDGDGQCQRNYGK